MSKFSIKVFVIYILSLVMIYVISKQVYWGVISTVLFLQLTNMFLRNWVDSKTKYKESINNESEKIRFIYTYFGFPITLMFKDYFKQIRKDSYYERAIEQLKNKIEFYNKHDIPITEDIKDDWIDCNRYLKLKKLKTKHQEI